MFSCFRYFSEAIQVKTSIVREIGKYLIYCNVYFVDRYDFREYAIDYDEHFISHIAFH
jgi:hypothetical protein